MKSEDRILAGTVALATLGEWLGFAEKLYAREKLALGQVATNAHDEALYLLLRTLGLPLDSNARVLARELAAGERAKVTEVLRRRAIERVPAAYLTHEAWLGEHRFYVDERAIIPRSYFLEIIPEQLPAWLPEGGRKVRRAADVCTGSGCLAILLARRFPQATVDAIDLSADALEVAKINVREHRLGRRVKLFESDVFDGVPDSGVAAGVPACRETGRKSRQARRPDDTTAGGYDVIVCNPPYEPSRLVDAQAPEFRAEPRMAHDGGADGMAIIRKLIRQARERLAPQGVLAIEVGGLRAAIEREFGAMEPHWLHTEDGSDCVCVFQAERMRPGVSRASDQ